MLRRENWPSSSLFPCRDLEMFKISLSVKCRYKGEKVPTTGLLRPGRRQRRPATPLSPISKYTPLDGSTRGNRAKHESRPYATAGKTGQAPSVSPVETCEISEISPSVKCRYKGEKVPTTDLLRPGRRERRPATALFLISMYTPLDGSTGERGPSTDVLSTATPREIRAWHLSPCRANIGSTKERGPAADFSRPGGRERVPGADLLSTATSREIRAWHSLSYRQYWLYRGKGQPRISLDRAVERECQARILALDRGERASRGFLSTGRSRESARRGSSLDRHLERNPRLALSLDRHAQRNPRLALSLDRHAQRKSALGTLSRPPRPEKSALTHSSPCRANVAKNFQSPKSKKKKSSHKVTLVRKLSSRATFLSHRQDKVRAGPYPGFFLSKNLHMQIGLGTKRRVSRRRIFWSQGIYEVTKGQAWACILEFGTPPGSGIWTLLKLFPSPVRAPNFSPPALKLPPGYPWEALPERVRNRPLGRLWRTRVWCARRHIWREDSPSGELGGARVSLHKLSREPLHVSPNIEFSPLPSPPGVRTP